MIGFHRTYGWSGRQPDLTLGILRQLLKDAEAAPDNTRVDVVVSPGDRPFETGMVYIKIPKEGL